MFYILIIGPHFFPLKQSVFLELRLLWGTAGAEIRLLTVILWAGYLQGNLEKDEKIGGKAEMK